MKPHPASNPFQGDPIMKNLIAKHQLKEYYGTADNNFLDLLRIVTGQQLSMKAAKSIFDRFLALYPKTPVPGDILATSDEKLRGVGLSGSKVKYVKNIAAAISSDTLPLNQLEKQSDDEVKRELIKIKGLGPWSVDMFLIFSLKRPDIFSVGDLGLRSAIEKLYGIKRNYHKAILTLAESWRPHRTLASRLLWASLE